MPQFLDDKFKILFEFRGLGFVKSSGRGVRKLVQKFFGGLILELGSLATLRILRPAGSRHLRKSPAPTHAAATAAHAAAASHTATHSTTASVAKIWALLSGFARLE